MIRPVHEVSAVSWLADLLNLFGLERRHTARLHSLSNLPPIVGNSTRIMFLRRCDCHSLHEFVRFAVVVENYTKVSITQLLYRFLEMQRSSRVSKTRSRSSFSSSGSSSHLLYRGSSCSAAPFSFIAATEMRLSPTGVTAVVVSKILIRKFEP
jgi:hypothetical protein